MTGSVLDAVTRAADRGEPLRPRDLLGYDPAAVRALFETGDIIRAPLRRGTASETVILPSCGPDDRDGEWAPSELQYLELAYTGGVSFAEMARALQRPGSDILRTAWRHDWTRNARPADSWGSEIPAWRIARLRRALDEAEYRGAAADDDGADLMAHRALRRRFDLGRMTASTAARRWHRWTDRERAELEEHYDRGESIGQIARALRRTKYGIAEKLAEYDLARCVNWTLDEDRIVVAGVERGLTNDQISTMLPGRTRVAVRIRARQLCGPRGADLWTEAERDALRTAVEAGANMREFARRVGRGISGVRWQCRYLGLSHPAAVVPYSTAEDRRIIEGWRRGERPAEVAADLGRPIKGVYGRAWKLGVTRSRGGKRKRIRRFEIEYIRVRVAQGWKAREIGAVLRRGPQAVYRIANRNGIRWSDHRTARAA